MVSRATRLLAGAVLAAGLGLPMAAHAQSNPFVPQSAASRAEIERIVDEKIKAAEARVLASMKTAAAKGGTSAAPGTPGAPVSPGSPGAPVTPGATGPGPLSPGGAGTAGPNYPPVGGVGGVNGMGVAAAPQQSEIAQARTGGTRFLGCINGTHKFMKQTGERVTFSQAQINRAVKDGDLPACR